MTTPATPAAHTTELTVREMQVISGCIHGRSNGEIGRLLYLSEDTVKTHLRRAYRKLGARDRAQAVALVYERGLIAMPVGSQPRVLQPAGGSMQFMTVGQATRGAARPASTPREATS